MLTGMSSPNESHVIGLLLSFEQLYEMATFLSAKRVPTVTVSNDSEAFGICSEEALAHNINLVPVDYPVGSKRPWIVVAFFLHNGAKKFSAKKWGQSRKAAKAREWLKARGVSGVDELRCASTFIY